MPLYSHNTYLGGTDCPLVNGSLKSAKHTLEGISYRNVLIFKEDVVLRVKFHKGRTTVHLFDFVANE